MRDDPRSYWNIPHNVVVDVLQAEVGWMQINWLPRSWTRLICDAPQTATTQRSRSPNKKHREAR